MALFTAEEARNEFRGDSPFSNTRGLILAIFGEELASLDRPRQRHDVFLSYSHMDAEIVLGICYILRHTFGLSVYLDRDDATLSADDIGVVSQLRQRMHWCSSLVYVASDNDSHSHWMPWELRYFDGFRGTVAVLPITESASTEKPQDRPYLRIYPFIDRTGAALCINDRKGHCRQFKEWLVEVRQT
jgi:hypothetical protein